jgi:cellulose synthase/poly-beta-1,6-N-acetylglucosamine synthase-like glycosyltransferase
MLSVFSIVFLVIIALCASYLWLIALASIRSLPKPLRSGDLNRFAIVIPAHNEEPVIGYTVAKLRQLNYPQDMFDICVVADFCSDQTSRMARDQGAFCYERLSGERGSKGAALRWLFQRIFESDRNYDAIVVFDADTRVDAEFLHVMNTQLNQGTQVIQGRHIISNPQEGWFPAITWAMMAIDNRFSNQGRSNLGLSAKHMGDSICFRCDILREKGWGSGLTEDYELRLKLILDGYSIQYEPWAIGHGQAPRSYPEAQSQRLRWAKGMMDARKRFRRQLLIDGIKQNDRVKLDGALGTIIPSYSTLTLISIALLGLNILFFRQVGVILVYFWLLLTVLWLIYPLFGLALEKAPFKAYLAILSGPLFILWRTGLNIRARLLPNKIKWIRTTHHTETSKSDENSKPSTNG